MEAKDLSNEELVIAFIKCFDAGEVQGGCHGCPLESEDKGCAYSIKTEIVKRLMHCEPVFPY